MWRVLLLDPSQRASLAVCRALGRAGHEVAVGAAASRGLAGRSRYAARFHLLPDARGPAAPFREAVEEVVARHGYDVVVAIHESSVGRLAHLVRSGQPLSVPSFPVVGPAFDLLTDKVGLADLCARVGVAYPRTRRLDDADVAAAVADLRLPVVVKAARSANADEHAVYHHQGATLARDVPGAERAAASFRAEGLVPIAQEWIDSVEKLNAVVIRRDGRTEVRYAHRVLREYPRAGGTGIALEAVSASSGSGAEAVDLLEAVCREAGYEGLAQAEMYRSRSDGRLVLVDVNPRFWGSTWFAERLGLRIVERGVGLVLGRAFPAPPARYRLGRRFHETWGEWAWLRARNGDDRGLRELLASTRPWDVFEGDQLSDPVPLVRYAFDQLRGRTRP